MTNSKNSILQTSEWQGLITLALPIVAIQVGMMAMGVVDNLMVGRLSSFDLAAATLGHTFSSATIFIFGGVLFALDPLVSQAKGAGDEERVRRHAERGLVMALLLSIPAIVIHLKGEFFLLLLGQAPDLALAGGQYVAACTMGVPAFLLIMAIRQTLQALNTTQAIVIAILVANVMNVVANALLIFGLAGLPELGLGGSGLATSFSRWFMVLGLVLFLGPGRRVFASGLQRDHHRLSAYGAMLRIGMPIAILVSLELWVFTAVTLLMGRAGKLALAGHAIAINIASVTFMVPLGIGMAAAARIGQAIGAEDEDLSIKRSRIPLALGVIVQLVFTLSLALFARNLAALYTDDRLVIEVAVTLLRIAAIFQLVDGLQSIAAGILRGSADTTVPAISALVGYWIIGLPAGYFLAHRGTSIDPTGYWWGLSIGLAVTAILLIARIFRRFSPGLLALTKVQAAKSGELM